MAVRRRGRTLAITIGAIALGAWSGCQDDSSDSALPGEQTADPVAGVAEAGGRTFGEPRLSLGLKVASPGAHYEVRGPVEPGEGRFRVESEIVSSTAQIHLGTVIGLDGEGFENTVQETGGLSGRDGQRCWFNPHAPVGSFLGTASVEESVRVIGAVLESLGSEVSSARRVESDSYEVFLKASAAHPRNDFRTTKERVWGDRNLLAQLAGPIEIGLSEEGRVGDVALRLPGYEPYVPFERDRSLDVTIDATLRPTEEELAIDPPECQAIE
jgi:hypothetical protein